MLNSTFFGSRPGCGLVVSILAFYLSSNPNEAYSFSVKTFFDTSEKKPGLAHF